MAFPLIDFLYACMQLCSQEQFVAKMKLNWKNQMHDHKCVFWVNKAVNGNISGQRPFNFTFTNSRQLLLTLIIVKLRYFVRETFNFNLCR